MSTDAEHTNGTAAPGGKDELSPQSNGGPTSSESAYAPDKTKGVKGNVKDAALRKLTTDIAQDAPMIADPEPVASKNEGKDKEETFDPSAPAGATAEASNSSLICGPILRYLHQSEDFSRWHGSAMIVLSEAGEPTMQFSAGSDTAQDVKGTLIFQEYEKRFFWRFDMEVKQTESDKKVSYTIDLPGHKVPPIKRSFVVQAAKKSFNVLFHSCNGFCDGADKAYKGPTLWKDVLKKHESEPFHVMIGGGDQIYSDGVREPGAPLEEWSQALSARKKAKIRFTDELREKVDQWYFTNSCDWFNTSPFREATSQIPSLNIWDDHDIIDGFGSYKDRWHRAPVFVGIGEIAWKYMCLFQQQVNPHTVKNPDADKPSAEDHEQLEYQDEPSYVVHPKVGPYIKHQGISLVSSLGEKVAFVGFDCRTDRTLKTICYQETYKAIFDRMEKAIVKGQTEHVLVLIGVPIAYPRLVPAEFLMQSHLITPLTYLHKAFGLFKGTFNAFDGAPELLDDMQDHWACGVHKKERKFLLLKLQDLSRRKQVRVTILSGDVHLAAVGRFFSKKKLQVPQTKDFRYMVNVISSAITNAPPPPAVAQVLNQRNKLHHLDASTDENMMKMFNVSAHDNSERINQTTYPSRNYCVIKQLTSDGGDPLQSITGDKPGQDPSNEDGDVRAKKVRGTAVSDGLETRDDGPDVSVGVGGPGAISVSIHIEVDPSKAEGETKPYAFAIPKLSTV